MMNRIAVVATGTVLALACAMPAQEAAKTTTNQEANIDTYVSLLRQDVKKGKVEILTEMMELTPDQAAKFWPVYKEYDKELTKLGDERVALIKFYGENYTSMTDQKVTE